MYYKKCQNNYILDMILISNIGGTTQ